MGKDGWCRREGNNCGMSWRHRHWDGKERKGKGEMAVGRLRNFQKAELSKRPDVQDQGGDDSSRGSLQ